MFRDLGKTNIDVGVLGLPYAKIEDNLFAVDTPSGCGIRLADTAAYATGKGFVIRYNEFIGNSATTTNSVGIVIAGTANTTAAGMIRSNFFSYGASASITQGKIQSAIIRNYGGEGAGGTLLDN